MRALSLLPLAAALTAATLASLTPLAALAAQQEAQRVVRGLSFEGNHAIDDYTLAAAIATTNSSAFATSPFLRWTGLGEKRYFDELEFRRDVVRVLLLYRQSGYMNAVVDTVVRREGRDVYVKFRIYEGEPVRLTRLDLVGLDSILDVRGLKHALPLQVGDAFNRFLFQASADTVVAWLKNRGYPYGDVLKSFDVDVTALAATAALEGVPGPRMRIGEVVIIGAERVDTATVRRMLSVSPHDWFQQDKLYQTQRDLYGLGMFRSVSVGLADTAPTAGPGDSTVPVVVRVSEAPLHRILLGGGYGSLDCFRMQAGWTAYDFFGGARALDVTGQLSKIGIGVPTDWGFGRNVCRPLLSDPTSDTANYSVSITLRQPTFFSPRHTATFGVFGERRSEFNAYTRQAVGLNVGLTINARRDVPVTVGYGYSVGRTTADPTAFCLFLTVCNLGDQSFFTKSRAYGAVTLSGTRGRVNSILDPTAGSLFHLTPVHASRYVLSDTLYEFNRGELEFSKYYPLSRRTVLAWRIRAGAILPQRLSLLGQSVQFVPPDQRFYAGGPNSVRGFARNELGPRVYVSDSFDVSGTGDTTYRNIRASPTGGNTVFTANLELRVPSPIFPDRVRVGAFVDVGQVWERGDTVTTVSGLRVTPGLGLRFVTPLGPVRLDAAYDGYPPEPGPLFFLNTTNKSLTKITTISPGLPPGFWRRVVVQFAVGQAF